MEKMDRKNQNCHDEGNQNSKGTWKHGLLMILCCLLPILILAGLPLFGIKEGILSSLAFLLCPLMHIAMMFMMRKSAHGGSCHGRTDNNNAVDDGGQRGN